MAARKTNATGFTLVEILAVIFIIGILAALTAGIGYKLSQRGDVAQTQVDIQALMAAVEVFHDVTLDYPQAAGWTTNGWLGQLNAVPEAVDRLAQLDPALFPSPPGDTVLDRFSSPIEYARDQGAGGRPVLRSLGPDGKPDTDDDIRSDGL
jgi:prepilin-type N-terminal cleavage/methylation domain-containing protein